MILVENITFMCGKLTFQGKGSAPLGCYKQKYDNGRELEVCSCESNAHGNKKPCNASEATVSVETLIGLLFVIFNLFFIV